VNETGRSRSGARALYRGETDSSGSGLQGVVPRRDAVVCAGVWASKEPAPVDAVLRRTWRARLTLGWEWTGRPTGGSRVGVSGPRNRGRKAVAVACAWAVACRSRETTCAAQGPESRGHKARLLDGSTAIDYALVVFLQLGINCGVGQDLPNQ
jgi:hypothetical protein